MDEILEDVMEYATLVLTVLSVAVALFLLVIARRTLFRSVAPQMECFLRPRESSQVFDLVIANFGMGCAYDVKLELQVDEDDFSSHHVVMEGWRSTETPFAVIEPGGAVTNMFGMGPPLLGRDKPPLKPFTARLTYEWQPFWAQRRKTDSQLRTVDIRAFQGLVPEWKKDELTETLKKELSKLTRAIERPRRPPLPADRKSTDAESLRRIEAAMPDLFAEMRTDLAKHPLRREFILQPKGAIYNAGSKEPFAYYYEDHPDLDDKVGLLVNEGVVTDITYNDVDRYIISEPLAAYLSAE